jgi:hypothetical protein
MTKNVKEGRKDRENEEQGVAWQLMAFANLVICSMLHVAESLSPPNQMIGITLASI